MSSKTATSPTSKGILDTQNEIINNLDTLDSNIIKLKKAQQKWLQSQSEVESIKSELTTANLKKHEAENRALVIKEQQRAAEVEKTELAGEKSTIEGEMISLKKEMTSAVANAETAAASATSQQREAENRINVLTQELAVEKKKSTDADSEKGTALLAVTAAQQELVAAQSGTADMVALKQQLVEANQRDATATERAAAVDKKEKDIILSIKTTQEGARAAVVTAQKEATARKGQIERLRQEQIKLSSDKEAIDAELVTAQKQVVSTNTNMEAQTRSMSLLSSEIAGLETELSTAKETLAVCVKALDKIKDKVSNTLSVANPTGGGRKSRRKRKSKKGGRKSKKKRKSKKGGKKSKKKRKSKKGGKKSKKKRKSRNLSKRKY